MLIVTLDPCQAGEGAWGHVVDDEVGKCMSQCSLRKWLPYKAIGVSPTGVSTCTVVPSGGNDQFHHLSM